MGEQILDGGGSGNLAQVNSDGRLKTYSKSASIQHVISEHEEGAFQVIGHANLSAGTVTCLHLTNESNVNCVITYLRHQVVAATGGTSFPNTSNYFQIALGRT